MRKNVTFAGLGIVLAAFIIFVLRLINAKFFQDNLNMLIVVGILGIIALVVGMIRRMNKATMFLGVGAIITAVSEFLVRMVFKDNVTLFVLFLVLGLAVLIIGLLKGR
jgi:hypothetical protein